MDGVLTERIWTDKVQTVSHNTDKVLCTPFMGVELYIKLHL